MWESNRQGGSRFPAQVVRAVRHRDRDECQLRYPGCLGVYQQIDHRVNVASTGVARAHASNDPEALQCVCVPCHDRKTAREASAGRQRMRSRARRRPESPAGLRW